MKYIILRIVFLFLIVCANSFTSVKAQVDESDSLALVNLYHSMHGAYWGHHENWLTGPVNTWFGIGVQNNRVTGISMGENKLSGKLPYSIGNLTALTHLILNNNEIKGIIPSSIGNLTNLIEINLSGNYLTGGVPSSIGRLIHLQIIYLAHNALSDPLPLSIGNLANLQILSLGYNNITGNIPPTIGKLSNLTFFTIFHNALNGNIPASIGNLSLLTYLDLNTNFLTGEIPGTFRNLTKLTNLNLEINNLTQDKNIDLSNVFVNRSAFINLNNNRFTFNAIESLGHLSQFKFECSEQAKLIIYQHDGILSVSAGGTLQNNTYTWHRLGETGSISIKADSTFHPAQSGKYYATVKNDNIKQLTLTTDTITYVIPSLTSEDFLADKSLSKLSDDSTFFIYPNPAQNIVHIQIAGRAIFTLTNSAGKTLFSQTLTNKGKINLNGFANGLYFIKNEATNERKKVIIVH